MRATAASVLLIVGVMRHRVKEKKINASNGLNKEGRSVKMEAKK
jgi:hypothetical protein